MFSREAGIGLSKCGQIRGILNFWAMAVSLLGHFCALFTMPYSKVLLLVKRYGSSNSKVCKNKVEGRRECFVCLCVICSWKLTLKYKGCLNCAKLKILGKLGHNHIV